MSSKQGLPALIGGLHHITCIAGDPQENVDFYVGVMGMRLVKRSVNQDSPDTYHLFYADAAGTPGTDLTFFPWPAMGPGRLGAGIAVEVALAVPAASLDAWRHRLASHGLDLTSSTRFGERTLTFHDPHGLALALVETSDHRAFVPWPESPVPPAEQVRGLHAVRIWERDLGPTASLLTERLGFHHLATEADWHRYGLPGNSSSPSLDPTDPPTSPSHSLSGTLIDLRETPGERLGQWGTGSVHHVAWRVRDTGDELQMREVVADAGLRPTAPIDRFWFTSVYFREPGGTLFELATEGPGFTVDEDPAHLGEHLVLPPWLEPMRAEIEAGLPPLRMPGR